MTREEAVEWDVPTWSRAILFWEEIIESQKVSLQNGLEIGANRGGISRYFVEKFQAHVYCTDYEYPFQAQNIHRKAGLNGKLSYAAVDATTMPFDENTFDFVTFKSVLGAVGRNNNFGLQQQAIKEIQRVLKPGGCLLFAENAKASKFHQFARRFFRSYGKTWRYVTLDEMEALLSDFSQKKIQTTGYLAAFAVRNPILNHFLAKVDKRLEFLPDNWQYVLYGYAIK